MKKITFCLLASLCMALSAYAGNSSGQFTGEIVVIVTSSNGKEEIKFNFSSEEDLKNFDIAQIGTDQLSHAHSIVVSVDSGDINLNYASIKLNLYMFDNNQKKNKVKDLCSYAIYVVTN